ncbi:hypothetical protein MCOR25_004880 [Pyricularia grisea]|nr:hypothetical protein MCOR25_004880 [Pyricularia grisea]
MDGFPLTVHSRVDSRALTVQLEERISQVESREENKVSSAYDNLRITFSMTLLVPISSLDSSSSLIRLGGNSLASIRPTNGLKKYGYAALAIQILRLDTIGELEKLFTAIPQAADEADYTIGDAVATDVQKKFLQRSLVNPGYSALIGTARYVGDRRDVPTASELHKAFVVALSAHGIFQTRFDAHTFTLSDLGRLNPAWQKVSVPPGEFETAIENEKIKALQASQDTVGIDLEVPYFAITVVAVPERHDIAFVTRVQHALVDGYSAALIVRDLDRALRGEPVMQGTAWADFARFKER